MKTINPYLFEKEIYPFQKKALPFESDKIATFMDQKSFEHHFNNHYTNHTDNMNKILEQHKEFQ